MEKNKIQKIKCLIWDLDNTLWNGILSEGDVLSVSGEVKKTIIELDKRGILQSVASKNNFEDAMDQLKKIELDHYFLFPQIGWNDKSESIARIQEKLNIGIDTIAFIDDQPFERDEVQFKFPDARTYSEDQISELCTYPEFIPNFITDESAKRREIYQTDIVRDKEEKKFDNNLEFLSSLNMKFSVKKASIEDLKRVEELTIRTNQLNATGYTYSFEELEAMLEDDSYLLLVAELEDKYGSYGKIGIALIEKREDAQVLKLLLMSCRVMSRGVGRVLLQLICNWSVETGKTLLAEFKPTSRNELMFYTYRLAGFEEIEPLNDEVKQLRLASTSKVSFPDFLEVKIENFAFEKLHIN